MLSSLACQANKARYYAYGVLGSQLSGQKLNILFSTYGGYIERLKFAFRFTPHQIRFEDLTRDNMAECDLVIPLTMDAFWFADEYRSVVPNNAFPIPTRRAQDSCDDKYLFSTCMADAGFSEYIPRFGQQLPFPYIRKKKVSYSSHNVFIIKDKADEAKYTEQLSSDEYYSQEMIPGQIEYATHILFKDNRIVKTLSIESRFQVDYPVKNHDHQLPLRICACPHLEVFADMLRAIGFEGLCCFDYKVLNGKPKVLEINPRFGSSLTQFVVPFVTASLKSQ
ncbi:MAG: hypothetical protein V7754_15750 [Halioglobus sp.]